MPAPPPSRFRAHMTEVPVRLMRGLVARRSMRANIRHVTAVHPGEASGDVAAVYAQMRAEVGLLPPLTVYSPQPRLLTAVWAVARESWLAAALPPATAEAIAATVSCVNDCPYCIDAHTMFLHGAGDPETAEWLRSHPRHPTEPGQNGDAVAWAAASLTPGAEIVADPPFAKADVTAAIALAVFFHMTNRVANVLLTDSAVPVPVPQGLRGAVRRLVAASLGRGLARRSLEPGLALALPPATDSGRVLPADLSWAAPVPAVAQAYARLAHVTNDLVREVMSEAAVSAVIERVGAWQGDPPGLTKAWVEEVTTDLGLADAPAARLALLTALGSWQAADADIHTVRRAGGDDASLVTVVAWGAFEAARHIGAWLRPAS
ncbi:MAG: carboxymuconolactone decarboxylase family protein [Acidimicrobiia bacterium]|nr:carboxymuconolactone decarboxylase family protein [Acidimicrobiia bacterium]